RGQARVSKGRGQHWIEVPHRNDETRFDQNVFGESTVESDTGTSQVGYVVAEVLFSAPARWTVSAASPHRHNRHRLATLESGNALTDLSDPAGDFVTQSKRWGRIEKL